MRDSAGFLLCSLLLVAPHCTEVAAQDPQPDPKTPCANWMGGAPGYPGHNGLPGRDGKDGKDGLKGEKGEQGWCERAVRWHQRSSARGWGGHGVSHHGC